MPKAAAIVVFVFVNTLLFSALKAQGPLSRVIESEHLGRTYKKKLKQTRNLLRRGEELLNEAARVEQKIKSLDATGTSDGLKLIRLRERRHRYLRSAGSFVEDAHRKQFRVLARVLKKECRAGFRSAEPTAREWLDAGTAIRRKSDNLSFRGNSGELLEQASALEQRGLDLLSLMLIEAWFLSEKGPAVLAQKADSIQSLPSRLMSGDAHSDTLAEPPPGVHDAVIAPPPDSVSHDEMKPGEAKTELLPPVEEERADVVKPEVYFTIQILASRVPLSDTKIAAAYNGERPVAEKQSDGWHRYSIGRFTTLGEAKKVMEQENIKGFIAAYHGQNRVTVKEALILKMNN